MEKIIVFSAREIIDYRVPTCPILKNMRSCNCTKEKCRFFRSRTERFIICRKDAHK